MKKILIYFIAILSSASLAVSAPLTAPRQTGMAIGTQITLPVYSGTTIYAGSMVAVNSTGYAVPASDTAGLKVIGRAEEGANNSTGDSGAINIQCRCGWFLWDASAGDKKKYNIGQIAYVSDDHTVTVSTSGSNKIIAGLVVDYDTVKNQLVVDSLYASSSVAASIASLAVSGNATIGGTFGVIGNTTLSSNVTPSLLTASKPVFTDASKNLVSTGTLGVDQGGSGATTLTDHGVLLGSGIGAITPMSVGTDGQMLLGASGADPTWQTASGAFTLAANGAATLIGNIDVARITNAMAGGSYSVPAASVDSGNLAVARLTNALAGSGYSISAARLTIGSVASAFDISAATNLPTSGLSDANLKKVALNDGGTLTNIPEAGVILGTNLGKLTLNNGASLTNLAAATAFPGYAVCVFTNVDANTGLTNVLTFIGNITPQP